jgi:hypothetical protein
MMENNQQISNKKQHGSVDVGDVLLFKKKSWQEVIKGCLDCNLDAASVRPCE